MDRNYLPDELGVENRLERFRPTPDRNAGAASRGRDRFLTEAELLRRPVSQGRFWRPMEWLKHLFPKEQRQMATLSAIVLVLSLFIGGSGTAIHAAQGALPDEPMYTIKLGSEAVRLYLARDPESHAALILDFSDERVFEIVSLITQGRRVPPEVIAQQRLDIDAALRVAATLDDAAMQRELLRIREVLTNQLASTGTTAEMASPVSIQLRETIRTQIALVNLGLGEPRLFRNQAATGFSGGTPNPTDTPAPQATDRPDRQQQTDQEQLQQSTVTPSRSVANPSHTPAQTPAVEPSRARQAEPMPLTVPTVTVQATPNHGTPSASTTPAQAKQQIQDESQVQTQEQAQQQTQTQEQAQQQTQTQEQVPPAQPASPPVQETQQQVQQGSGSPSSSQPAPQSEPAKPSGSGASGSGSRH
jgi:hypothetical protein